MQEIGKFKPKATNNFVAKFLISLTIELRLKEATKYGHHYSFDFRNFTFFSWSTITDVKRYGHIAWHFFLLWFRLQN